LHTEHSEFASKLYELVPGCYERNKHLKICCEQLNGHKKVILVLMEMLIKKTVGSGSGDLGVLFYGLHG
jgi:hypothetical protein